MTLSSKHGYRYLRKVVFKTYKWHLRYIFIVVAVVVLLCFAYTSWSAVCFYRFYKEFYRPIPREAYCEPGLFDYGVGQHEVRKSFSRFAAKQPGVPPKNGPSTVLYWRSVQTIRDLKNFLQAALRENFDPTSTLATSRRFLRTMELNLNRIVPKEVLHASLTTLETLKQRIFSTIDDLQNPPSCQDAVNCEITNESGLSSGLHDVLYCLVFALQRNRTIALNTSKWHNFAESPWRSFFRELGSCPSAPDQDQVNLKEYRKYIKFLPSNIGKDITEHHGDPYAWWFGILMAYVLRPSETLKASLDEYLKMQTGGRSYVAIHIRRTDKIGEASYRPLEAYVSEAEEYFARLSLTQDVTEKLVYVATDDPSLLDDLDKRFKSYKFISNKDVASEANSYSKRRKASAVLGIMKDYHMLSHADHLVCTLSSGFCRLAYELMNGIRNDAWLRISSLDTDFLYAFVLQDERTLAEPYEDGVYVSEIRGAYRSDVPESYEQMVTVTLDKSYSPFGADGFTYTNDEQKIMAKFKTLPSCPTMDYNSSISRINV